MTTQPYVNCVEGCPMSTRPISLPFPNDSAAVPSTQNTWPPDDWHAYVVCPLCGRILHRSSAQVRWEPVPQDINRFQEDNVWFCVAFECGVCKAPMQLCLEMRGTSSPTDVMKQVNRAHGVMECGHECHGIRESGGDIFRVQGTIPAYRVEGFSGAA
jgi:hypothetical protein